MAAVVCAYLSGKLCGLVAGGSDVPGKQLCDAIHRMIGNASQHFAEIGFGIEVVEFRRSNQTVDGRRVPSARIQSSE